eukprot:COSAG04_NODE_188_length_20978_cov_7.733225_19_plen_333_part_00
MLPTLERMAELPLGPVLYTAMEELWSGQVVDLSEERRDFEGFEPYHPGGSDSEGESSDGEGTARMIPSWKHGSPNRLITSQAIEHYNGRTEPKKVLIPDGYMDNKAAVSAFLIRKSDQKMFSLTAGREGVGDDSLYDSRGLTSGPRSDNSFLREEEWKSSMERLEYDWPIPGTGEKTASGAMLEGRLHTRLLFEKCEHTEGRRIPSCPSGHALAPRIVDDDQHFCDVCAAKIADAGMEGMDDSHYFGVGSRVWGCEACEYDMCEQCHVDAKKDALRCGDIELHLRPDALGEPQEEYEHEGVYGEWGPQDARIRQLTSLLKLIETPELASRWV